MASPGTPYARPRARPQGRVQSVARAVDIIYALLGAPRGLPLRELAAQVGLHKATTLRLLRTLQSQGLVQQPARGGPYLLSAGSQLRMLPLVLDLHSVAALAQRLLRRLSRRTGAAAALVVPDAARRATVPVLSALPARTRPAPPHLSRPVPFHASASGKHFLAALAPRELTRWLAPGLVRLTTSTIASAAALRRELRTVRTQGYAVSRQEQAPDAWAIAVPLRDRTGSMPGALELYSSQSLTAQALQEWPGLLQEVAEALSASLPSSTNER